MIMGLNPSNMKHSVKIQNLFREQQISLKRRFTQCAQTLSEKAKTRKTCSSRKIQKAKQFDSSINALDDCGYAQLHNIAQSGDVQKLKDILDVEGLDINIKSSANNGCTPAIVYAASNGYTECVELLLLHGAQVNETDQWQNSALFKASSCNYVECVKILLSNGADSNIGNKWGTLPVQIAALQGYTQVVKLLLDHGATLTPDAIGYYGDTSLPPPIVATATRCHLSCLRMILAECKQSEFTTHLDSALTMAMYYFLGACAGFQNTLQCTTVQERFECMKMLIEHGATVSNEHVKMTCYHYFIPLLNLKAYIQMLKFILQSVRFEAASMEWNYTMMELFGHVTRLGKYKWELIELICSIGFTPSKDLIDGLEFTLTDEETLQLHNLRSKPRKLSDICRQKVREHSKGNAYYAINHLKLPTMLKSFLLVNDLREG